MRKFLLQIFIFLTPFILFLILEALMPPTFFTFRVWEALSFRFSAYSGSPFYLNQKTTTNSVGDLCHHTSKAVQKKEYWTTDKLGYRNDEYIDQADVLFIGDSFIAGSSLNQDETISNQLKYKLNNTRKIYNLAPSTFSQFEYYLKTGVIKKPKVVIFSIVERNVPPPIYAIKDNPLRAEIVNILKYGQMNMYVDRALKLYSLHWLQARINGLNGIGIQAVGDSTMYFKEGKLQKHSKRDLDTEISVIKSYKDYCDSNGILFIFMPMPDKETVYYELVPFKKQPNYLLLLDSLLHIHNIATINTLRIYNDYRKKNRNLLYHTDDTHWNVNATKLMATEIAKQIK